MSGQYFTWQIGPHLSPRRLVALALKLISCSPLHRTLSLGLQALHIASAELFA